MFRSFTRHFLPDWEHEDSCCLTGYFPVDHRFCSCHMALCSATLVSSCELGSIDSSLDGVESFANIALVIMQCNIDVSLQHTFPGRPRARKIFISLGKSGS